METLEQVLDDLNSELKALRASEGRSGSRYFGPNADADYVRKHVEQDTDRVRTAPRGGGSTLKGAEFLRAIKAARQGDPAAHRALAGYEAKTWNEATGATGGYLVPPEFLPKYVEQRRAAAPLVWDECAQFETNSNSVTIVTEGSPVTVAFTGESVSKTDSTGSLGTKISTVFKLAGVSHISDELWDDAQGIETLVARQFTTSIDLAAERAVLNGSGTGEPMGILGTSGLVKTGVGGQTGQLLFDSVLGAINRRVQAFYPPTLVVMHPREALKFQTARDSQNRYLFGPIESLFGPNVRVILDSNIPTNLGVSTTESVILVGDLKQAVYVFTRQHLTIDVSTHAAFVTDEHLVRAVKRWGAACVQPAAVEALTGITP